ncbi:MAG: type III-B CRISPR-associated protein Cas10/Cmr2 [Geminicoccaceae bacterium]|nr:type III-B CRISPR-associated protein Cas10/Cmr2 [Geminicoccaceae bacterium]
MSGHLLLLTIGPVQEFIAQARRTRDLWYGSHLLSELARAAARALVQEGAELVLPALGAHDPELEPCPGFLRENRTPPASIANKLLAIVPQGRNPAATARAVRAAVLAFWRDELAAPVKEKCRALLAHDVDEIWDEQIESFVEFYASWAPLDGDYAEARRKLERTVAGRKMLREFAPWKHDRAGAPKSSLDGARVSVLAEVRSKDLVKKYRLNPGEQLDAVGLVKRAGGEPDQFVPLVNVALAGWIVEAEQLAGDELARLRERARELDLSRVNRGDLAWTKAFPFDASALIESRVAPTFEELGIAGDPQAFVRRELRPLYRKIAEPSPYVACLVADGDKMGERLDQLRDPDAHRDFSSKLAGFAAKVRKMVELEHRGSLVYAGGDDVLAFLPVVDAVSCADRLRRSFEDVVGGTLSVGIGIGHVMEGMGDLLELGRRAERLAKTLRKALGVILDKRSGERREWKASWCIDPANRLREDAKLVDEKLSTKKIHEIAAVLRRLPEPGTVEGDGVAWQRVLEGEVRRALARNEPEALTAEEVGLELPASYAQAHEAVGRWVDRLLIARAIAEAQPRPRRPSVAEAA